MNTNQLLEMCSYAGKLLIQNGAEIYRVEESMERMVKAYGYQQVEVFAIPSYFNLSVVLNDHSTYTITKRSRQNRINLDSVYALNNLVRKICLHCLSNQEIE
ncbi:MAG: threonine/serine exporter family protein, partial [Longicatena sp.]